MTYVTARGVEAALASMREFGSGACFIAGGTALQLAWPDGRLDRPVVDISCVDMGPVASAQAGLLRVAANARLEDVRRDPAVRVHAPILADMIAQIGALGVRHLATVGGNIAWRCGDLVPLLLVLDATLRFAGDSTRPLAAGFDWPLGDLIVSVEIPLPIPPLCLAEKIGLRAAFSPSVITVAAAHGASPRIAVGGGPVPPALLPTPSLSGSFEDLAGTIAKTIVAPDDIAATGAYRAQAASRVLADFLLAAP
jgi:CO/xanthine dehydrogenase FAD-binding subunit